MKLFLNILSSSILIEFRCQFSAEQLAGVYQYETLTEMSATSPMLRLHFRWSVS